MLSVSRGEQESDFDEDKSIATKKDDDKKNTAFEVGAHRCTTPEK